MGEVFVGPLKAFAGALSWTAAPGAVRAADLADPRLFDALVLRLQVTSACSDRNAAISFWSQLYFSRLVVAAVAVTLHRGHALPLGLDAMRVSFCDRTGHPLAFALGPPTRPAPTDALLAPLIDQHLAPLIAILREQSGLSARLFWENAGHYLFWSLSETARLRPTCPTVARALDEIAALGPRHPLAGLQASAATGAPIRRRLCCLRHRIPGWSRCEGLCPLKAGAATSRPIVAQGPTGYATER